MVKFLRLFRQMFLLSCYSKVSHARRSGKEHFESKNIQILACEVQFMQQFCYLTVFKPVPICCKILLGDVRRIIVAFTDDKILVTGFLAIILNAA